MQRKPKFICISGKAQHGKDTCASFIYEHLGAIGFKTVIIHYADLLKHICKQYFSWDGQKDDAGRSLLQHVGTDVIRRKIPDYWVDHVIKIVELFPEEWDYIIIPDVRFPNEINRLKENGYRVYHIEIFRPDFDNGLTEEQKKHPSETALDNTLPNAIIINDGDIFDLEKKCHQIADRFPLSFDF